MENKPGAGGNLGTDFVAKSAADGYTLVFVASNILAINPSLYKKMPFDAAALAPVANIAKLPNVVVVNPENRYRIKTFADLIATAKQQPPDSLNFGSTGNGSMHHMIGAVLANVAGKKMTHIPYKGSGPMLQGLYGNEADVASDNLPAVLPHINSQRLNALMVTGSQRSPLLPNVPTATELGYPALQLTSWFGLVAPAGTDPLVVAALNNQINAALKSEAVRAHLLSLGTQPAPGSPAEFRDFIKAEAARLAPIVKESGATVD